MEKMQRYENYPIGTILISNSVSITIYALGFLIVLNLGLAFSFLYALSILIFEHRLLRYHCTNSFSLFNLHCSLLTV